ncbi:HEPN domain-containing protein [Klebsiella pneumoniae]|uniref:HEPN domain-containing protein n=1 Tax=Klebsiella pneumoniae TaxID=573 RepID=UPI0013D1F576|nr:HEPN domain-containing protein [Klebsiella pneumoniae]
MDYSVDIMKAFDTLVRVNTNLYNRYILPHIGVVDSTDEVFSLDVKSYLILLHAAIEDYIEGISVFTSNAACEPFKNEGKITLPLMFLFAKSKSFKDRVSDKKLSEELHDSPRDFMVSSLGDINANAVAGAIDNNGINVRYLNNLLQHCGINFDVSENDFISWKSLADYRGDYAHAVVFNHGKKPKATKLISPEDARDLGNDCIRFSEKIRDEALSSLGLN